jgi:hypothetical protein
MSVCSRAQGRQQVMQRSVPQESAVWHAAMWVVVVCALFVATSSAIAQSGPGRWLLMGPASFYGIPHVAYDPTTGAMLVGNGGDKLLGLGVYRFYSDRRPRWERLAPRYDGFGGNTQGEAWVVDRKRGLLITHSGALRSDFGTYALECNANALPSRPDVLVIDLSTGAVNGGSLNSQNPQGPLWRQDHVAVVDSLRDEMIVIGGKRCHEDALVYGRTLETKQWKAYPSLNAPSGPDMQAPCKAMWSPSRSAIVVAGNGLGGIFAITIDSVARWTRMPEASASLLAFGASDIFFDDAQDAAILLSAAGDRVGVLQLATGLLESRSVGNGQVLPPNRGIGYDPIRKKLFAFGGVAAVASELDLRAGGAWRVVGSAVTPGAGVYALAYSARSNAVYGYGMWVEGGDFTGCNVWRYDATADMWSENGRMCLEVSKYNALAVDNKRNELWLVTTDRLGVKSLATSVDGVEVPLPIGYQGYGDTAPAIAYDARRERLIIAAANQVYAVDCASRSASIVAVDGYVGSPGTAYYDSLADRFVCVGSQSFTIEFSGVSPRWEAKPHLNAGSPRGTVAWNSEHRVLYKVMGNSAYYAEGDLNRAWVAMWTEGPSPRLGDNASCVYSTQDHALVAFGGESSNFEGRNPSNFPEHEANNPFLYILEMSGRDPLLPSDLVLAGQNGWASAVVPSNALVSGASEVAGGVPRFMSGKTYLHAGVGAAVGDTASWRLRVAVDGAVVGDTVAMGSGSRVFLNFDAGRITGGRHEVVAEVDPVNQVREVDEGNNRLLKQWLWEPLLKAVDTDSVMSAPPRSGVGPLPNCDALRFVRDQRFGWLVAWAPYDTTDRYQMVIYSDLGSGQSGLQVPVRSPGPMTGGTRYVVGSFRDVQEEVLPAITDPSGVGSRSGYRVSISESRDRQSSLSRVGWPQELLPAGRMGRLYEANLQAGRRYNFELATFSPGAKLGLEIFSPVNGLVQYAGEGVRGVTVGTSPVDTVGYVPAVTGWHQIVVARQQGAGEGSVQYGLAWARDEAILAVGAGSSVPGVAVLGPWPNPSSGVMRFEVSLTAGDEIAMEVFDVSGRSVARSGPQRMVAGGNGVSLALAGEGAKRVSPGLYLVRIKGRAWQMDKRVVVVQ